MYLKAGVMYNFYSSLNYLILAARDCSREAIRNQKVVIDKYYDTCNNNI